LDHSTPSKSLDERTTMKSAARGEPEVQGTQVPAAELSRVVELLVAVVQGVNSDEAGTVRRWLAALMAPNPNPEDVAARELERAFPH
jgi:hypothetical protein